MMHEEQFANDIQKADNLTDGQLCRLAQSGDRKAEEDLVLRYIRLVRACARRYFLAGGDSEDLIQEGMMGLIKAVREFDPERETSFFAYAELCIKSRLYSALRTAARAKHGPLNNYVPLEAPFFDSFISSSADYPLHRLLDPEELVIGREKTKELTESLMGLLSGFEAKVLGLYLKGLSYQEIAMTRHRPPKSVDNAVQRVRKKLAHYFSTQCDSR
jgi:RNA polymerase sporulation-specific sigma factor